MTCSKCDNLGHEVDINSLHVIRTCPDCHREYPALDPGKHGKGIEVDRGDRFVIPANFIKLAVNPLKGSGTFTREGIAWFSEMVFGVDIVKKESRDNVQSTLTKMQEANEEFFKHAEYIEGLDWNTPEDAEEAGRRILERKGTVEFWGYLAAGFSFDATEAIKRSDVAAATLSAATSERLRALAIFKGHFEEAMFMANSARRLIELISIWDANKENSDEAFWQLTLQEHAYAFGQLFSAPVTFVEATAYVGGMKLDKSDARYLDFLLSEINLQHAILIEIKTPETKLLGRKYRGNAYPASRDLSGSFVQIHDYVDQLRGDIDRIARETGRDMEAFNPHRIVLIGNYKKELDDPVKRRSFELFRRSLSGVDIITFDEFFLKAEELAKLFDLSRRQ